MVSPEPLRYYGRFSWARPIGLVSMGIAVEVLLWILIRTCEGRWRPHWLGDDFRENFLVAGYPLLFLGGCALFLRRPSARPLLLGFACLELLSVTIYVMCCCFLPELGLQSRDWRGLHWFLLGQRELPSNVLFGFFLMGWLICRKTRPAVAEHNEEGASAHTLLGVSSLLLGVRMVLDATLALAALAWCASRTPQFAPTHPITAIVCGMDCFHFLREAMPIPVGISLALTGVGVLRRCPWLSALHLVYVSMVLCYGWVLLYLGTGRFEDAIIYWGWEGDAALWPEASPVVTRFSIFIYPLLVWLVQVASWRRFRRCRLVTPLGRRGIAPLLVGMILLALPVAVAIWARYWRTTPVP